jgi:radical SAM protein with 4Fe4S-binding SPASM domain
VRLVAHGAKLGLSIGLTPSATPRVTPGLLARLADAGLARLAISVDGPDARTHDGFRGRAGSYERSLEILRSARALGLSTQVNTTVYADTIHALDAMAACVGALGASLWSVFYLVPTGRARARMLPSAAAVEASLLRLTDIAATAPFAVKTTAAPHYRRVVLERRKATGTDVAVGTRGRQALWVNDGRGMLFVSHRGDVYPSGFLPLPCGNVREADPIDVYRHHPLFRTLRDSDALRGKCGACAYRNVCGGSRARSFAMTGDVLRSDPLCSFVPPGYAGPAGIWPGRAETGSEAVAP